MQSKLIILSYILCLNVFHHRIEIGGTFFIVGFNPQGGTKKSWFHFGSALVPLWFHPFNHISMWIDTKSGTEILKNVIKHS
jgi:hypothetical protein